MGNYTIEPVEPLDYHLCFYQPMGKTVTNRCHNIFIPSCLGQLMLVIHWKPFQFTTHDNLLGGKTPLEESDQNIRQFKSSQKWLIHVTSPNTIQQSDNVNTETYQAEVILILHQILITYLQVNV